MRRRSRWAVAVIAAAMLAGCGSSDGTAENSDTADVGATASDASGKEGEQLPPVEIIGLTEPGTTTLADLEGPAVINLWATWCAPCRKEIPDFEAVHQLRSDEVRFIGINIGEDADRADEFLGEIGATYDQFLDSEGYVVTELRTTAMPVTIVIDGDGVVTTRHLGPLDQDGLNEAIDAAIG